MILAEMMTETVVYYREHSYGSEAMSIMGVGVLAISVPCCGWYGARERDESLLFCFSFWNCCLGCWDIFVIGCFTALLVLATVMGRAATACHAGVATDSCDAEQRERLAGYCRSFEMAINESILNITTTDIQVDNATAEVMALLSEQRCLDTLVGVSFVLVVFAVIFIVARCFGGCLHCASGHYGNQLRALLKENDQFCTESDSD